MFSLRALKNLRAATCRVFMGESGVFMGEIGKPQREIVAPDPRPQEVPAPEKTPEPQPAHQ